MAGSLTVCCLGTCCPSILHLGACFEYKAALHALWHEEHEGALPVPVQSGHGLGRGLDQIDAVQIQVKGQDGILLCPYPKVEGYLLLFQGQHHCLTGTVLCLYMVLVVVHE